MIDRRSFFVGSASVAAGSAALTSLTGQSPATLAGATGSGGVAPVRVDPAIDQIVEIFGGWKYDQQKAERLLAEAKTSKARAELPDWVRFYRRRSHGIQCAMQAEKTGADEGFIVAALLHDIGHVFSPPAPRGHERRYDDLHEIYGAQWLRNLFVSEVTEPILRHVPAKRWLVTKKDGYYDHLSSGSKDSLRRQGGKMGEKELAAFEALPFWKEGVDLRVWDDNAKVKGLKLEPIERYLPMMERSLKKQG